jgi:imidazolonepropionase-like amidohydrolase
MKRVLIHGGTIVDGTGAEPFAGSLLIEDDKIAAVGPEADAKAGDAERVDAAGQTVMPGMVDAHVHISFGEPHSTDELFFHRDEARSAILSAWNAQKVLRAGFTGMCDANSTWNIAAAVRDSIDCGLVQGPRLSAGGLAIMNSVAGTAGTLIPDKGQRGYGVVCTTPDEMRHEVRRQIRHGADWIKVFSTGLIPGVPGDEVQVITDDELKLICDTAHQAGTPVIAHSRNPDAIVACANAGVDVILHLSYIDDRGVEAIVENDVKGVVPTWTFLQLLIDHGVTVGSAERYIDLFKEEIEATAGGVKKLHEAGVPILTGSETGFALTPYGEWHAMELELLCRYLDLTPLEAIACATKNGAIALKKEGQVGALQPGMLADVLVVDGDPVADVKILQDRSVFTQIYKGGVAVDLTTPWPERTYFPGEKVGVFADKVLTRDLVGLTPRFANGRNGANGHAPGNGHADLDLPELARSTSH